METWYCSDNCNAVCKQPSTDSLRMVSPQVTVVSCQIHEAHPELYEGVAEQGSLHETSLEF